MADLARMTSQQLLDLYLKQLKAAPSPTQLYEREKAAAGVPVYETELSRLRGLLYGAEGAPGIISRYEEKPEEVTERLGAYGLTEAQRMRRVEAERAPLQKELGRLTTLYEKGQTTLASALESLKTRLGLAELGEEQKIRPYKTAYEAALTREEVQARKEAEARAGVPSYAQRVAEEERAEAKSATAISNKVLDTFEEITKRPQAVGGRMAQLKSATERLAKAHPAYAGEIRMKANEYMDALREEAKGGIWAGTTAPTVTGVPWTARAMERGLFGGRFTGGFFQRLFR